MSTTKEFAELYLQDILARLKMYKSLADDAVAQLDDEHLFAALDEESNSMAVLLKHMAGNMRSRWTNFLTSDGEKPWRQRDAEFMIEEADAKTALLDHWEESWQLVFETVKSLDADDLKRTVTVRGESHTVMEAINRRSQVVCRTRANNALSKPLLVIPHSDAESPKLGHLLVIWRY